MTQLGERFDEALVFTRQRHARQLRKGTTIPYLVHLLSTAALVLESGGDEDQAIAGLLHDSVEDREYTGVTYEELAERFGERVTKIVRDCSHPEPESGETWSWRELKDRYLAQLRAADPDSQLVANADKLHNARSILFDHRLIGEQLWTRFNPEADQLWYYRSLVHIFLEAGAPLASELERVVGELERELPASS